jgi:glycosyltransferase involved in cell wall biosynthesis
MRTQRGREAVLEQAVRSVLDQTHTDVELVVVEDGSAEVAPVLEGPRAGSRVAVVHLPIAGAGRAAAGNAGVDRATGDLLGFVDDDDELFPGHVAALAEELAKASTAPAAYAAAIETRSVTLCEHPLRLGDVGERVQDPVPFSRERLWQGNFMPIQAVLFRRAAWETCGGFDESLPYLEDWDLWLRFAMLGDFIAVGEVTSRYRVPAERRRARRRRHGHERCIAAVRDKQAALAAKLPPAQRFPGIDDIVSGAFDRRRRMKEGLARIPLARGLRRLLAARATRVLD